MFSFFLWPVCLHKGKWPSFSSGDNDNCSHLTATSLNTHRASQEKLMHALNLQYLKPMQKEQSRWLSKELPRNPRHSCFYSTRSSERLTCRTRNASAAGWACTEDLAAWSSLWHFAYSDKFHKNNDCPLLIFLPDQGAERKILRTGYLWKVNHSNRAAHWTEKYRSYFNHFSLYPAAFQNNLQVKNSQFSGLTGMLYSTAW